MSINIVLFHNNPKSLRDRVVNYFTGDKFRHAAIMFPDVTGDLMFEATGSKNQALAYRRFASLKNCKVTVLTLNDLNEKNILTRAVEKIGTRYDWKGILLWWRNQQVPGAVYCFEYIATVLSSGSSGIRNQIQLIRDGSVSGLDIYKVALQNMATEATYEF